MVQTTNEEKEIINNIEEKVCKYFDVEPQDIVNYNRTAQASLARGYIFYILHKDYGLSIGKIENTYSRKKRVVFWHINKVKFLLKQRMYKEIYNNICDIKK